MILFGKKWLSYSNKICKDSKLNFCIEKNLNYIEVSAKINDNVVKMLKEPVDQLYNDIKKDKVKNIYSQ